MQFISFGARCFNERCILEGLCIPGRGLERVIESNSLLLQVAASSNPLSSILKLVRVWVFSVSISSNFQLKFVSHLFISVVLKSFISLYLLLPWSNKQNSSVTLQAFHSYGHLHGPSPHIPARIPWLNLYTLFQMRSHQVLVQRTALYFPIFSNTSFDTS